MRLLLDHGIDLRATACISAFEIAIERRHVDIVRLLIEANSNLKLGVFQPTLRYAEEFMASALKSGSLPVVELLREIGVEVFRPPEYDRVSATARKNTITYF